MQASYVINARDQSIGFSMMQAILPQLSLGGMIEELGNDSIIFQFIADFISFGI